MIKQIWRAGPKVTLKVKGRFPFWDIMLNQYVLIKPTDWTIEGIQQTVLTEEQAAYTALCQPFWETSQHIFKTAIFLIDQI